MQKNSASKVLYLAISIAVCIHYSVPAGAQSISLESNDNLPCEGALHLAQKAYIRVYEAPSRIIVYDRALAFWDIYDFAKSCAGVQELAYLFEENRLSRERIEESAHNSVDDCFIDEFFVCGTGGPGGGSSSSSSAAFSFRLPEGVILIQE